MFTILIGKLTVGNSAARTAEEALKKAKSIDDCGQSPTILHDGENYSLMEFQRLVVRGRWDLNF